MLNKSFSDVHKKKASKIAGSSKVIKDEYYFLTKRLVTANPLEMNRTK